MGTKHHLRSLPNIANYQLDSNDNYTIIAVASNY